MRRALLMVLGSVVAVALFAALVHFVLVVAHVSEPAATTVRGLTVRRLWASTAAALGLAGAIGGALAAARRGKTGEGWGRRGTILALVAGPLAVVNGGLNLALADGGPGTGNGVVGAAAAVVLGMVAVALAGVAIARGRNPITEPEQLT